MISYGIHVARSIADKEISSLRREGLKVKLIAKNFISFPVRVVPTLAN